MNGVKGAVVLVVLLGASLLWSAEPTAAQRGEQKLLGRNYVPGVVPLASYHNAWKLWGVQERPADFDAAARARYGLHPAPYPNNGLPMGLRETTGLLGGKVLATDCLLCH